ncbi:MAG: choice-of-anchor D domain-containing protein [Deltaproteobacteria bacterium]|nr:choice-of-anchor D domain-containing protein [Deltaproteobacteria bacterium]
MTKQRKRIVGVGIVAIVAAVTAVGAAPGFEGFTFEPKIRVIRHANGLGAAGTVNLRNVGTTSVTIDAITPAGGCDPSITVSPTGPFTIAAGGMQVLTLTCPPSLPVGMRRCNFTASSADVLATSFLAVCETQGTNVLAWPPTPVLSFGTVPVGSTSAIQTIQLSNFGSAGMNVATLQLQLDDDNFLIGTPCNPNAIGCDVSGIGPAAGSATTVAVMCRPTKSGAITGHLHGIGSNGFHASDTVTLLCTGSGAAGPAIQVTPPTVDVGSVEVANGSGSAIVTVRNVGSGMLMVNSLSVTSSILGAANDWAIQIAGQCNNVPCPLAGSQQLNLTTVLDPSAPGPRTSTLIVAYNDGANRTSEVSLGGTGVAPTLNLVSGATLDFGVVPVGTPVTQAFVVGNFGNRALTDGAITPNPIGAPFTIQPNPLVVPVSPPNTSVNVTCGSSAPTTADTTIALSSPSAFGSSSVSVNLRCEVRNTELLVSPTSTQLGEIRTQSAVQTKTYMVTSTGSGSQAIPVTSVALASANPNLAIASPTGAATTPFMINMTVNPTVDGPIDTSIVITPTNGGLMPIAVPVTGLVTTPGYEVPPEVSLGTFCVGQSTSATNVALKSTGTATLGLTAPALQMNPAPFDLAFTTPVQYPATLPAGTQAMVQVSPKRRMVPGPVDDVLVWTTDATPATRTTTLRAEFVDDGGAIAPSMLEFGKVPIHTQTANGQRVTLQNCDVSPLTITSIHADEPFAIDGTTPATLLPGESASISIVFRPTQVGAATGTLQITAAQLNGQVLTVALSGEGIAGGGGGGDDDDPFHGDRTSFYACGVCNSSNPTGLIAVTVGLAIALLPRRRRRRG